MKKIKTYKAGLWLVAILLAFTACNNNGRHKMPRMYPLYLYRDKEPMGTNIAYRLLPDQFNGDISLASKKNLRSCERVCVSERHSIYNYR